MQIRNDNGTDRNAVPSNKQVAGDCQLIVNLRDLSNARTDGNGSSHRGRPWTSSSTGHCLYPLGLVFCCCCTTTKASGDRAANMLQAVRSEAAVASV